MNRQIFGTGIQHVEQGHLAVGIHLVNMDHIPVAQKLYDIIIGCVGIQATHAQQKKECADFHPYCHVLIPTDCSRMHIQIYLR